MEPVKDSFIGSKLCRLLIKIGKVNMISFPQFTGKRRYFSCQGFQKGRLSASIRSADTDFLPPPDPKADLLYRSVISDLHLLTLTDPLAAVMLRQDLLPMDHSLILFRLLDPFHPFQNLLSRTGKGSLFRLMLKTLDQII